MVIWVTGMAGSGKTTLCQAVAGLVRKNIPELVLLDGDVIRDLFGNDLDYSEPSRERQIDRMYRLAKFLADQNMVVLVAALYAHPDLLARNRATLPGYFEVYLQAPMDVLHQRDKKGLYSGAAGGTTKNVVGFDIPWHAPEHADLVMAADSKTSVHDMAVALARAVPRLRSALDA